MKAIYFDGDKPVLNSNYPDTQNNEVKIKIIYAGICGTDIEIFKGYMNFIGVPGHEFVGIVVESNDPKLLGKRVVGEINTGCGKCDKCKIDLSRHCQNRTVLGIYKRDGAFSEYITLPEKNLHIIPEVIKDEDAVFIEPLAAAFEILEQVTFNPNWKVAVVGDGRLSQLICRVLILSNKNITCFGKHQSKLDMLSKLGITPKIGISENDHQSFDFVVEATGRDSGFMDTMKLAKPRGIVILKSTIVSHGKIDLTPAVINEIQIIGSRCGRFNPAINALSTGQIIVNDLVSKTFSIDNYKEAFDYASKPGVLKVLLRP
jgi:threonine dehydrogenase-like Zn-dependent dehydrogenase